MAVMRVSLFKSAQETSGSSYGPATIIRRSESNLTIMLVPITRHNSNNPATNPPCKFAHSRKKGGIHHCTEPLPSRQRFNNHERTAIPSNVMSCVLAPRYGSATQREHAHANQR